MQKDKTIWPYPSNLHCNAKLYIPLRPGGACKRITVEVSSIKAEKIKLPSLYLWLNRISVVLG